MWLECRKILDKVPARVVKKSVGSLESVQNPGWCRRDNQGWNPWFRVVQFSFVLTQDRLELKNSTLKRESALNQLYSALIFLALTNWKISARWFSADLLWINCETYTCRWDYQISINWSVQKVIWHYWYSKNYISPIFFRTEIKIFLKIQLQFFAIFLKVQPTKRENVSGNLNHISFVTWTVPKYPEIPFSGISLFREKIEQHNFCSFIFTNCVENDHCVPPNWCLINFFQKKEKLTENFWIRKNQHCSALFQRKLDLI